MMGGKVINLKAVITVVAKLLMYLGFVPGCIFIFLGCYLLNDFANQNIQVYEGAYVSFVVFVISVSYTHLTLPTILLV